VTTYRTGNHHGTTIVAENDGARCGRPGHDCARGHLVAVVVDGGVELAERICALLNADAEWACFPCGYRNRGGICTHCGWVRTNGTPDVTYLRGASEALAEVRRRLKIASALGRPFTEATIDMALGIAAMELGVAEKAPRASRCEPQSDETGSGVARDTPGDLRGCEGRCALKPDPDCPVHQGRRPKGPKPPPLGPGCVCDGSGRTCPRHGAVI
jgi:hypothetical protein